MYRNYGSFDEEEEHTPSPHVDGLIRERLEKNSLPISSYSNNEHINHQLQHQQQQEQINSSSDITDSSNYVYYNDDDDEEDDDDDQDFEVGGTNSKGRSGTNSKGGGSAAGKEKRKRQAAACDECRRRKRGCDGKVPCNQCAKKGLACTFVMERRRQTRKTMEITDAAAAQGAMVAPHLTSAGAAALGNINAQHTKKPNQGIKNGNSNNVLSPRGGNNSARKLASPETSSSTSSYENGIVGNNNNNNNAAAAAGGSVGVASAAGAVCTCFGDLNKAGSCPSCSSAASTCTPSYMRSGGGGASASGATGGAAGGIGGLAAVPIFSQHGNHDLASMQSDFLTASHTAVMVDLFFEHYSCAFGCINRETLLRPLERAHEFLQHAVLAVVNRSFGDANAKQHHEKEARRIAGLVSNDFVEETVQGFLVLSFYYGSENVLLAAQFAKMAESVLQEAEGRIGRSCGLLKLRGLCRSMRCHTDVNALLDSPYRLPKFAAGEKPDASDPCTLQRIVGGVLAELLRADGELVHTFYSSNPFQTWPTLGQIPHDRADNLVEAVEFALGEMGTEKMSCLPVSARWGIVITLLSMRALVQWMAQRFDDSIRTVSEAIFYSRPSASQFLSAKPFVVPFLAALAIVADSASRYDLLLEISNLLLRLGRSFRSAWLGYNEVVARLPHGVSLPAPVSRPPPSTSANNSRRGSDAAGAAGAAAAIAAMQAVAEAKMSPVDGNNNNGNNNNNHHFQFTGGIDRSQTSGSVASHSSLASSAPTPPFTTVGTPAFTNNNNNNINNNQNHLKNGAQYIDNSSSNNSLMNPGSFLKSEFEDEMQQTLESILPASTLDADATSLLQKSEAAKACDPLMSGMQSWDEVQPSDWRDFWLLSQTLTQ